MDLEELQAPIGDFILAQNDIQPVNTENGAMYHYADVCKLLNRLDAAKNTSILTFYAVRSSDGKFFKRYGWHLKYQDMFVDDIGKARIYAKPGPAKSRITVFAKRFPTEQKADLVELHITNISIFDEATFKKIKKSSKLPKNSANEKDYFKLKI